MVTDDQTGGRGRLGRDWVSQPGKDLTFSVLLRPSLAPARAHLLSLAAALAVAETLETIPGLEGQVGVKWPNDVLLGGRKVCGILVEGSMDSDRLHWAVAGIGLNVNSDSAAFARGAGPEALQEWTGRPEPVSLGHSWAPHLARAPLLAQLLARLSERWSAVEGGDLLPVCGSATFSGAWRWRCSRVRRPTRRSWPARRPASVKRGSYSCARPTAGTVQVFAGDVTCGAAGKRRAGKPVRGIGLTGVARAY